MNDERQCPIRKNSFHQFSVRRRELGHQMFKRSIGKLIGKNLGEFDDLRNVQGCNSIDIYNLG